MPQGKGKAMRDGTIGTINGDNRRWMQHGFYRSVSEYLICILDSSG